MSATPDVSHLLMSWLKDVANENIELRRRHTIRHGERTSPQPLPPSATALLHARAHLKRVELHVLHGSHLRRDPVSDVLVEGRSVVEHVSHDRHLRGDPFADVLVEVRGAEKNGTAQEARKTI